jgi:hypothetical protein
MFVSHTPRPALLRNPLSSSTSRLTTDGATSRRLEQVQAPEGRLARAASWFSASCRSVGSAVGGAASRAVSWVKAQGARLTTHCAAEPAAKSEIPMEDVRRSQPLWTALKAFSKREHSPENPLFIEVADKFLILAERADSVPAKAELAVAFKNLMENFVGQDAPYMVNLPSQVAKSLSKVAAHFDAGAVKAVVQHARMEIFDMVRNDSFRRFLGSDECRMAMQEHGLRS